jgi:hypothetical protein
MSRIKVTSLRGGAFAADLSSVQLDFATQQGLLGIEMKAAAFLKMVNDLKKTAATAAAHHADMSGKPLQLAQPIASIQIALAEGEPTLVLTIETPDGLMQRYSLPAAEAEGLATDIAAAGRTKMGAPTPRAH